MGKRLGSVRVRRSTYWPIITNIINIDIDIDTVAVTDKIKEPDRPAVTPKRLVHTVRLIVTHITQVTNSA